MNFFQSVFKKTFTDFSFSALSASVILVLVGISSSAPLIFQAAHDYGVSPEDTSSWLGSLCIAMGILSLFFSFKNKVPILFAWSTPGTALILTAAKQFSLNEAVGAFIGSAFLIFLSGITGIFEKSLSKIPTSLSSALLAGVLIHFCTDSFKMFNDPNSILILVMFITFLIGRKWFTRYAILTVLIVATAYCSFFHFTHFNDLRFSMTSFQFTKPIFHLKAFINLSLPLFMVTMTSQNLTGISVMRANQFFPKISPLITASGFFNLITAPFGGFTINLAAITASIAMSSESHPKPEKRYMAGVLSGLFYFLIGCFATTLSLFFSSFPKAMILSLTGFALLSTVSHSLENCFQQNVKPAEKEAAFLTFIIAASSFEWLGIGSSFWAIMVGGFTFFFFQSSKK